MKPRYYFMIMLGALAFAGWRSVSHTHHAGSLATAILSKDQRGQDTTAVQAALSLYTHAHMGTARTVVLKSSYDRAAAAAVAAASPQSNGAVYAAAQSACASRADSITQARCVQSYVASHTTAGANPQVATPPVLADYTKHFAAPAFSTDSVGIALLAALALFMGGITAILQRHTR